MCDYTFRPNYKSGGREAIFYSAKKDCMPGNLCIILTRRKQSNEREIMAQAIMDPEKVRRFADELHRFNTDLENRIILLQARFTSLGDTWQDQEHEKFAEEFKLAMKALKKFNELSKEHTPYLLRKAQRIEEYLHQR